METDKVQNTVYKDAQRSQGKSRQTQRKLQQHKKDMKVIKKNPSEMKDTLT